VNGTSAGFGPVSFDCPPTAGGLVGTLPITLDLRTATQTRTLDGNSPNCRAVGFQSDKCMCDTCGGGANNGAACATASECPGGACGGRRCRGGTNNGVVCGVDSECPGGACGVPGLKTAPNQCDDATCVATTGNEGECSGGPFEQFCDIERFRGCSSNADCTKAGDSCSFGKFRECYTDNGVDGNALQVQGNPEPFVGGVSNGTLGSFFCVGPTTSGSVNAVAGLPGLGRLTLPGTATLIP